VITEEQKQLRKKYIGASDSAALFGLSPWDNAGNIYLDKIGQLEEWRGTDATHQGNRYEAVTIEMVGEKIGRPVEDAKMIVSDDELLCANLDGYFTDELGTITSVVEAKYSSMAEEWGEEGTDQIPPQYTIQVHHQMYVAGPRCRFAYVGVTLIEFSRLNFRLYLVERDDDLAETVAAAGRKFMTDHVIPRIPPEDFLPTADALKRVRRVPNKTVSVPFELIDNLIVAKAALKKAQEDCELAERHVKTVMGDAEGATDSMGRGLTYYEQNRRSFVMPESKFRVLKLIKKG
jgi:putative phage-type endonuclease